MRRVVIVACAGLLVAPAAGLAQTARTGWFELVVPGSLERILAPGFPDQPGRACCGI